MGTGAKVAIGCGIAVAVVGIGVTAVMVGGFYWAKGKVEQTVGQVAEREKQIDGLKKKANANPFTPPADGVIQEARLLKLLDVRRQVFDVYKRNEAVIARMGNKKNGDSASLGDIKDTFTIINEVRLAQAQALAAQGMSEDEYRYLGIEVYKALGASEFAKENDGKTPSQFVGEAGDAYGKTGEGLDKAAEQLQGQPGGAELEKLKEGLGEFGKEARKLGEQTQSALDVPPANIALVRKHEADIKKYAMPGLEFLGL